MSSAKRPLGVLGWTALFLLTGCPTATQHPAQRPAPGQIIGNTRVNPVVLLDSNLPDPFTYVDTVQSQAPNTVSLKVNELYQSLVGNFIRVKFPLTANPALASPEDAPRIVIRLTYLNLDPRWTMGTTFAVLATVDLQLDVKIAGRLHEQVFHASGSGLRTSAWTDSVSAALRAAIPMMNDYLASLNL